eukprot:1161687-Pelagomonas_calceolata.AAC.12
MLNSIVKPGWQLVDLQANGGCLTGQASMSVHNSIFAPRFCCKPLVGCNKAADGCGFKEKHIGTLLSE